MRTRTKIIALAASGAAAASVAIAAASVAIAAASAPAGAAEVAQSSGPYLQGFLRRPDAGPRAAEVAQSSGPYLQVCNVAAGASNAVIDFHGSRYGPRTVEARTYSCSQYRVLPAGYPLTLRFDAPGRATKVTEWLMPNYRARITVTGDPASPTYLMDRVL